MQFSTGKYERKTRIFINNCEQISIACRSWLDLLKTNTGALVQLLYKVFLVMNVRTVVLVVHRSYKVQIYALLIC